MDTHGMKFVVDTSGVAKGFREYRSAVDGIFASLSKFEAHVEKTMRGVAKASSNPQAINSFKRAVSAFAKVDIDTSAAKKLSALSAAMQGFKAPSAAQTQNAKRFFNSLSNLPDLGKAYRSIKAMNDLKAAMSGFKAPPASAAKNLSAFASAMRTAAPAFASLRNVNGTARVANELSILGGAFKNLKVPSAAQIANLGNFGLALRSFNFSNLGKSGNFYATLGAIGQFRAPSPAQIRNLQNFVNAVGQMRVPPNASGVAAALNQIAAAANRAGLSLGGLRSGMGGLGASMGRMGGQSRQASIQMMGLQNAFSSTFQAGSVLRSLLGSLTIAELGRNFFEATNAAIAFKAQMGVINKDLAFADAQMSYVSETANSFGVDMIGAAQGFAKVSIAADKSGISVMQTRHIFEGLSSAMTVLGTTTAGQQDVWLALQQVMNKGYLSAEELNQQLNEKLPGAMAYATEYAESLGMSLEKGLKSKALDAAGVLAHIAKRMKEDFGPAVAGALMRPAAQMNILRNNFDQLFIAIGEAGGNEAFSNLLFSINERMKPEDIERYAQAIGEGLKNAVDKVAAAFDWLYQNWDSIKGPLSTTLELMGKWALISGTLQIARFIVTPLMAIGPALGGLRAFGGILTALTASSLPAAVAGVNALGVAQSRGVTASLALRNAIAAKALAARGATVSIAGLATATKGLAAASVAAARGGIASLAAMFGGPLVIGLAAATYAAYKWYDVISTGNSTIAGNSKFIDENRQKLDELKNSIVFKTIADQESKKQTDFMSIALDAGSTAMSIYKSEMDKATNGLFSMALQAKETAKNLLLVQQAQIGARIIATREASSREWYKARDKDYANGNYLRGGFRGIRGRGQQAAQALGIAEDESVVQGSLQSLNNELAGVNAALAKVEAVDPVKVAQNMAKGGYGGNPRTGSALGSETAGGNKGRKGPKGQTFEQIRNKLEGDVDQLMDKLMDADPVGKLYADFVKDLTNQGHALLNEKGYKTFIENLKVDAKDGEVSVQSLIDAMADSGNLSTAAMNDIKNRYGKTTEQVVAMLKQQQEALEDSYKEAVIKQMDKDFRALAKGMELVGDSIPVVAEMKTNMDSLAELARFAMPGDAGFVQFMTELRSGALTADDAMAKLAATMADPKLRSAGFSQFLEQSGTSPEEIIAAEKRKQSAAAVTRHNAKIDLEFGTRLLAQRKDEILLLSLSAREADAYRAVQEEVIRIRAAGGEVTRESTAALLEEVKAQQTLAEQMQRNRDFFENNGVRTYLNNLTDVGTAINDLDKNFLQSLEDQLFSLGTTGKFSFKAIFDTIQQGLVRFASQGIMKTLTEKVFSGGELDGGTPSIFGGLFKMFGQKHAPAQVGKLGTQTNPMYVAWANGVAINPFDGALLKGKGLMDAIVGDPEAAALQNEAALTGPINNISQIIRNDWANGAKGIGGILGQIAGSLGGGGGGGLGGLLGGAISLGMSALAPGGGMIAGSLGADVSSMMAANAGIFKEGGYPGSPVSSASIHPSAFTNAPHYAEGTPNTSGGHPAILHDNEAVIPLSRGRKVAVELAGGSRGQQINNNFNISTPDANSFKKSKQQIATDMHMQAGRAYGRNK